MANTYVDYTATSSQTDFAFTFPYLKDTHVIVSIDGTEYDVNSTGAGSFTIVTSPSKLVRLDAGATAGANVRVKRNSLGLAQDESALVDYNDGSVLTEKDLDDAYLHNFYLSQEAVEGASGGLALDSSVTNWDANNKKIINVGDPTNTKDAANKTYVDTQISNTVTGSTTAAQKWTFTGDNTETEFTFSPAISLDADTAYTVAIDGVLQEPTTAYTIDADTDKITFTSAPPTSANIVVISRGYTVPVTSGTGTVTSVTAGNGLSGGTITSTGTVSIPTSGGDLNINSGKVGIAGDASASYSAKITGDLLISDNYTTGVNAHLTLENTHATDGKAIIKASAAGDAVLQLKDTATTGTDDAIYNVASASGKFVISGINDAETVTTTLMQLDPGGGVKFDQLPTSDPSVAGELWNDGGVVSVSGSSGFSGGVSKYDSGWVTTDGSTTVANGATLTFTHGLSTTALNAQIWISGSSDGSNPYLMDIQETFSDTGMVGAGITNITSTQITIQFADSGYVYMNSSGQNATSTTNGHDAASNGYVPFTSKYVRVVAIG
tara:strand:- start:1122 stop:2774 length:1653 start_codon:yes stop_codon:yes gene_type:complete